MTTAVFLDRDGTLNVEKGYLRHVDDLALLPGAARAIAALNQAGILAILTTNQTGAARGFYPESHIVDLNQRLQALLYEEAQASLDAIFYCPHLAKGTIAPYNTDCNCRKPATGMIEMACEQFPMIQRAQSFVVGDKASDVTFAHQAGCTSILVKTGYGERVLAGKYQALTHPPHWVCDDIVEAVHVIIRESSHPQKN
ncbi:MAG: HAD family hydrolase [Candidatus Melainabacteria bacterium]|nr:HAD family hydrolase [Candidatus Melainabacteria bacterium]